MPDSACLCSSIRGNSHREAKDDVVLMTTPLRLRGREMAATAASNPAMAETAALANRRPSGVSSILRPWFRRRVTGTPTTASISLSERLTAEWEMPNRAEADRTPPSSMTAAKARKWIKAGNMVYLIDQFCLRLNQFFSSASLVSASMIATEGRIQC
ncbi:hypothetical protein [uncultured Hoeflea sp.]|uniref:hypothetical protein n=1 Tax=uncultured Hoeflea sp. TaxID=538666 RepID=UPI00262DDEAF|nr:hypothetical protein [uncultured Hoeflea sp.]